MNTLWIFGDSFSSDFDYKNLHENHKTYMDIFNIEYIPVWASVLGEKLGYDVEEVIMNLQQNLLQGDLTLPEGLKRESFVDD